MKTTFETLCEAEQLTLEEIADKNYMKDKIAIWLENGFITDDEFFDFEEEIDPTLFISENGIAIKDPNLSECLRFKVDPKEYYGQPYLNYLEEGK